MTPSYRRQNRKLTQLHKCKRESYASLRESLNLLDYICTVTFIRRQVQKRNSIIQAKHKRKLDRLRGSDLLNPDKLITNLSSYRLNDTEKSILVLGLNFAITPSKIKASNFAVPIETLARKLKTLPLWRNSGISWTAVNAKLRELAFTSTHSYRPKNFNLSKKQFAALTKLRRNKNIIILKPDKGNGVVVMDRTDYISKMMDILHDTNKFQHLPKAKLINLSIRTEEILQAELRKLRNNGLDEHIYKASYPHWYKNWIIIRTSKNS